MEQQVEATITVNGTRLTRRIEPRMHLIDFLREELGLTGSHVACEHGVCGACTVRIDGEIRRGCLTLAVQADGRKVDTVEGLSDSGELAELHPDVAQNISESEAVRQAIRDKALRDSLMGGTRGDIQESRRFFSEADWPKADRKSHV
mgnify:CR=1 FL=1